MAIRLSKTSKIISIIFIVILSVAFAFLLWRVNQEDTVAPEDSDASDAGELNCPTNCYEHQTLKICTGKGGCVGVNKAGKCDSGLVLTSGWCCDPCEEPQSGGCASIPNTGSAGDAGSSCEPPNCGGKSCGEYTYKCGTLCYKASCGAGACGYVEPVTKYTLTYGADTGGTISGTKSQTVEEGKSGSAVTAVPNAGYSFKGWSDSKTTNATRTDSNVKGNITATATFQALQYTLKYSADSNGSITGSATQTVNYGASGTKVTAVPKTNYRFASWSDGVKTAERTDSNVVANKTVTANFTIIGTYSLTYVAGPNGSITGNLSQSVNHGSSGTQVEAVPDMGYYFIKWSDDSTVNPRIDTNVSKDINVTATFLNNCGNGVCDEDENANSCPSDCPAVCGDGYCTHSESTDSCAADCGSTVVVPQTGLFDSSLGRMASGLFLVILGIVVYRLPYFSLSIRVKNGKMYINNKSLEKRRLSFEKKFR
jgi:uncharacterized repeat protein (TIGR02543 family)